MADLTGVRIFKAGADIVSADWHVSVQELDEQMTFVGLVTPAFASDLPQRICTEIFAAMDAAILAAENEPGLCLKAALTAANKMLFEHNLRTDVENQILAGVGALLWDQTIAYAMLLGPVCMAGLAGTKFYEVHGLEDGHSTNKFADATRVAGLELGVNARFFSVPLAEQDALLLTSDSPDINLRDLLAGLVGNSDAEGKTHWDGLNGDARVAAFVASTSSQDLHMPASTVPLHRVEFLDAPSRLPSEQVQEETLPIVEILDDDEEYVEEENEFDALAEIEADESDSIKTVIKVEDDEGLFADPDIATESDEDIDQDETDDGFESATEVDLVESEADFEPELDIEPELDSEPESTQGPTEPEEEESGKSEFAFPWEKAAPEEPVSVELDNEPEDEDYWDEGDALDESTVDRPVTKQRRHETWDRTRAWFSGAIRRMEEWAVGVLPDKLPERPKETAKKETVALSGRALVLIAMAIPIVMLIFVLITRVQYDRAIETQFDTIQLAAQNAYQMADSATDAAVQRQYLEEALLQSEQGLAMRPDDTLLTTLKTRVEHDLDQINVVERIYTFYKLAELDEYTSSSTDSARILLQDNDLYLLHRGSNRVYHYVMNDVGDALEAVGTDPLLVQEGQVYDGTAASELVDMAWISDDGLRGTSVFAVLDRAGTLFAFDDALGVTALPVANSQTWRQPVAMSAYYGNLYVLDTLLGSLLKYEPVDDAYTKAPSAYISANLGSDLTGAVDLAVDGNMYILFADGHIDKYYNGVQEPFNSLSVPESMLNPTAIFVSGEQDPEAVGYIYVADSGNERIVQFDKDGNYVRQFQSKIGGSELEDIRGLYVDEETQRIFVLSGRSLWLGTLPSL